MPTSPVSPRVRYERGAARIFGPDGIPVGAGFLVAEDLLCTCAHVVATADGAEPPGPVEVDFPLLVGARPGPRVSATVESWRPQDDVAVLRLARELPGTEPLPLVGNDGEEWNRDVRAFGFPAGASCGVNATGTLRGRQRADRLQLDLRTEGVRIGPGFSGAAVWDPQDDVVVGMAVARGKGVIADTAYLVTTDQLIDPDLLQCPFRDLRRFESEDARYFHGRENEVAKLVEALAVRPVTVLVGPSGSGKSSLLRAGLITAVTEQGTPWALRVPKSSSGAGAVAGATAEEADDWVTEAVVAAWQEAVPDEAAWDARCDALRQACAGTDTDRLRLRGRLGRELCRAGAVLFLDQFEEYAAISPEGALRAFRHLSVLAQAPDSAQGGGLRVVLTARSATTEVLTAAETSTLLDEAVMFLPPMTEAALTRAVEGPVRAVPGLRLDPGLTRRLVGDALGEPGCLPLLQFVLTRLWEQRKGHTMTLAAYERSGGVLKALARYADGALKAGLSTTGTTPETARRLFQQLARPDGQGGFTRRALPTDRLEQGQAALARDLAARRLLVWDVRDRPLSPDATGTVQVVHEALLQEWDQVRTWLHEGLEFREWQERTARDAAEWKAAGRSDGLLPHGARLAEGLRWLTDRPTDLSKTERVYLEAGRRRQRRGLRRLWAVTCLVTVLTVLASTLAVNTYRAHQRDLGQLHTAAATELAGLATDVAERSPDSAFRYAAGAWSTRHSPVAQRALFGQYVRAQDVRSSYSGLWPGTAEWSSMSPDGRAVVVLSRPNGAAHLTATAVSGAVDGTPRATRLKGVPTDLRLHTFRDAVSDDGRHYALATTEGTVLLWNLTDPEALPRRLSGDMADRGDVYAPRLDFSEDGNRLLYFVPFEKPRPEDDGRKGLVQLWDTDSGNALPISQNTVAQENPAMAWLLGDGNRIAVASTRKADGMYLDIYATATGERVRRVYGPEPGLNQTPADRDRGVWLVGHLSVRWYSLVPGADQPSGTYRRTATFTDLTGTHLYGEKTVRSETGQYRRMTLLDPRGGERRYWSLVLPGDDSSRVLGVVGSGSGPRTVLATEGDTLLRARPTPVPGEPTELSSISSDAAALAPDGSRTARLHAGQLMITGSGNRVRHTPLPEKVRKQKDLDLRLLWVTRKGRDAVLVWSQQSTNARLYEADNPSADISLTWDCGRTGNETWNLPEDIVQTGDGDLVVLCLGDSLARVDPRSAVQSGKPILLERTPVERGNFASSGQLATRPSHSHQVAVVTGMWPDNGRIEVWDVRGGTRVARLEKEPLDYGPGSNHHRGIARYVAFTSDGDRLATFDDEQRVVWWNVADERADPPTHALEGAIGLLGVTPNGTLLATSEGSDAGLYSPDDGEPLGLLNGTGYSLQAFRTSGNTLHMVTDNGNRTLRLSPDAWYDTLCAALHGANSRAQRDRPQLGMAKETPPCLSD
ncbi:nSTAND1 domain-containing NTPase [Streptomyces malaysiensis]|uniref:nSTAND1 domain-containing NTPase n=1 Tax=Streptomyces malaysiensis TaxID=92644 RepID=UPI00321FEBEF|nr:trypsin-like peptidase domain-containing protein [Streptomyces malaysiensis]